MIVIILENAPNRLRGRLALWLLEVRAGVYVGNYSKRTRQQIWAEVEAEIKDHEEASAVLVWTTNNASGYNFKTLGANRRVPHHLDGAKLIQFLPEEEENLPDQDIFDPKNEDYIDYG